MNENHLHKRVVSFIELVDKIPTKAKFLYSESIVVILEETPKEKQKRMLSDSEPMQPRITVGKVYYEVSEEDFQELLQSGYFSESPTDKYLTMHTQFKLYEKRN
jgi:hypothetical protein